MGDRELDPINESQTDKMLESIDFRKSYQSPIPQNNNYGYENTNDDEDESIFRSILKKKYSTPSVVPTTTPISPPTSSYISKNDNSMEIDMTPISSEMNATDFTDINEESVPDDQPPFIDTTPDELDKLLEQNNLEITPYLEKEAQKYLSTAKQTIQKINTQHSPHKTHRRNSKRAISKIRPKTQTKKRTYIRTETKKRIIRKKRTISKKTGVQHVQKNKKNKLVDVKTRPQFQRINNFYNY